jgi:hypothetical protein
LPAVKCGRKSDHRRSSVLALRKVECYGAFCAHYRLWQNRHSLGSTAAIEKTSFPTHPHRGGGSEKQYFIFHPRTQRRGQQNAILHFPPTHPEEGAGGTGRHPDPSVFFPFPDTQLWIRLNPFFLYCRYLSEICSGAAICACRG